MFNLMFIYIYINIYTHTHIHPHTHAQNYPHNQDHDISITAKAFFMSLCSPSLSSPNLCIQETTDWLSITLDQLGFYTNEAILYVFVWSCFFYFTILRPTMLLHLAKINSFLLLSSIRFYGWTPVCLYIYLLMNTWVGSSSWLIQM